MSPKHARGRGAGPVRPPDTVAGGRARPGRALPPGQQPPGFDRVLPTMSDPARRWPPSRRTLSLAGSTLAVVGLVIAGTLVLSGGTRAGVAMRPPGGSSPAGSSSPSGPPTAGPTTPAGLAPPQVDVKVKGFFSWALLDRRTG